jgi:type IV pilus assembly protein PilM
MLLDKLKGLVMDPPPGMAFEISEAGIASARMGTRPEIEFHPLKAGTLDISPVKENVVDPEEFANTVKKLVNSQVGRKQKDVALILPDYSTRLAVLDFDSFPSDPKEQASLVRFRLKRSVPFDVESAAMSYFAQTAARKKIEVVVALAPLEIVSRYEAPFRAVGLNPGLVTTSALAALELAPESGLSVMAKMAGTVLTVPVRDKGHLRLVRCLEVPSNSLDDIAAVLLPTFVYIEDNLGGRPDKLLLCGFGEDTDEAVRRFRDELGVEVDPLRSSLGVPGAYNAGLMGYMRSVARIN